MKFATVLALLASASATFGNADVKTLALKDQMKSLQSIVSMAQEKDSEMMLDAIAGRKEELEYQLALAGPSANKQAVANELKYLLDLVQNIENDDFDGAAQTLQHRTNKLVKYQLSL